MTESYLTSLKNLGQILQSLKNALAPDRFTIKFLENLGYKSANDRLIIGVLKGIGFLDSNSAPTELYMRFLDDNQSKFILAEGIRSAYKELFQTNTKAYDLSLGDLKGKFKTILSGTKGPEVLTKMASTFKALCTFADFSNTDLIKKAEEPKKEEPKTGGFFSGNNFEDSNLVPLVQKHINTELHYNIQIHLPETKDLAVYDAIFKSLKEHLL